MSQAPVTWTYHSEELALNFNADFIGATQDPKTLAIAPHVGWFITYADKPLCARAYYSNSIKVVTYWQP
jgi:hypothetical protein